MRVLVVGADGFIGRNVSDAFTGGGDDVFYGVRNTPKGVDNERYCKFDLLDGSTIRNTMAAVNPDVVVNCAGIVDPTQNVDNNKLFTQNLIEGVVDSGQKVERIIICGSAGVYGHVEENELPVTEDTPLRATSAYGMSKKAEEETALELGAKHNLPITIARIFNPIGTGMGPKFLISNILNQLVQWKHGERSDLEVGRLDAKRDYVAIEDVALAIKALAHGGTGGMVYNVGSGRATSNGQLIGLILENYGVNPMPPIKETLKVPEPPVASQADITRINKDVGWKPKITLEDSVRKVVYEAKRKQ